ADLRVGDLGKRHRLGIVPEEQDLDRVLRVFRLDELDHREGDLLRRRETVLSIEDHRVRDVDRERRRTGRQVLDLVDLEVLGRQADLVGVPPNRVANRAHAVDGSRVVAEFVGAGFWQDVAARAGSGNRVIARSGFRERREDLFQCRAADAAFAARGQRQRSIAVFDDLVLLELLAEFAEVDAGVDDAAVLEVLHPAQRLFHIPAALENKLKEELDELLVRQQRAEQIDRIVFVAVAHYELSARQLSAASQRVDQQILSLRTQSRSPAARGFQQEGAVAGREEAIAELPKLRDLLDRA